ncbi:hypothetical protein AB205_0128920, partial [Aquarana catesbeiana]
NFLFICRHLQKTGAIEDLVIISEKPLLRGIVRLIAVTGEEAREAAERVPSLLERHGQRPVIVDCVEEESLPV